MQQSNSIEIIFFKNKIPLHYNKLKYTEVTPLYNMRFKTIFSLLFLFLSPSLILAQTNVTDAIRLDIKKRIPSFKEKKFKEMEWQYWIIGRGDNEFGDDIRIQLCYTLSGEWRYDSWLIHKHLPKKLRHVIEKNGGIENMGRVSFNDTPTAQYYIIAYKNGKHTTANTKFKELPHAPLPIEGMLSSDIKADMQRRLKNAYVKAALVKKYGEYQFFITFQKEDGEYLQGNITYSPNGEWLMTAYDLLDFQKLPFELMMHVMDNGGVKKFQNIALLITPFTTVYEVTFKDGSRNVLNENFEVTLTQSTTSILAQTNDTESIRMDLKKRIPSFTIQKFDEIERLYWIRGEADNEFGDNIPIKVCYTLTGEWRYDRWDLNKNVPKKLGPVIEKNGGTENLGQVSFNNTPTAQYYTIRYKNGTHITANTKFKEPHVPGDTLNVSRVDALVFNAIDRTVDSLIVAITGRAEITEGEGASMAFDGNHQTKWLDNGGAPWHRASCWIQIQLTAAVSIDALTITSANDASERDPKDFALKGSNDGTNWTILGRWTGQEWSHRFEEKTFGCVRTAAFSYFRLEIMKNKGGSDLTQLSEIRLIDTQKVPE